MTMRTERCPWCGKKINPKVDRVKTPRTTVGSRFTDFGCCPHCNRFYGQGFSVNRLAVCLVLVILGLILLSMLSPKLAYCAVFPVAVLIFVWIRTRPIRRMDERENLIPLETSILTATVRPAPSQKIGKNTLYFFSDDFDAYDSFQTVSPIFIRSVNRKSGEITFSFLYEQPLNRAYVEREGDASYPIFDSEMQLTAEITQIRA